MMSLADAVHQTERALLGSILQENSLWPQTDLAAEDFGLSAHRIIYRLMAEMFEDGRPVDIVSLTMELSQRDQLAACGDAGYLASLLEHAFPPNCGEYARTIRSTSRERRYKHLFENLSQRTTAADRLADLEQMQAVLKDDATAQDWRSLFHSYVDVINAPPARFVIDGFLQADGITVIGALAGHGKTLSLLAISRALLEGGKLFHHFQVTAKSERVIYLIPEAGLGPFAARLKTFHLQEHIDAGRLFCRTLSAQGQLSLTDPRLLEAVKGADVFLDTAVRFMDGAEDAENSRIFADDLFGLQRAGARTITGAHHSPKSFGKDNFMTLENVLRGSGDIGAMLATCWGLSQVDAASNRIFVQNCKARDFQPCEPFIIQGRPSIDQTGYFELTHPPGFAGDLSDHKSADRKAGRPENEQKGEKQAQARRLRDQGMIYRHISEVLDIKVGTLHRWLREGA
jgi:DnaB-like helicase N terminal domain/AAA domain